MVINSDNISLCNLISSAHNNPHTGINVLQLNSVNNITSVGTEQLIESLLNDDYVKHQFTSSSKLRPNLVNKNGKRLVTKVNC